MDRPRFSAVLYNRRRELGVTIEQAARALYLKDRVLEAFENGDWDSMPKSGYAQGMLSSYARYLGLNTRELTQLFSEDLEDYQEAQGNDDLRLRGPDSTSVRSVNNGGRRDAYMGAHGLLPTSGGYAGDLYNYATVSDVSVRGSYGLEEPRPSGSRASSAYSYGQLSSASSAVGAAAYASGATEGGNGRRYTTREPLSRGGSSSRQTRQRKSYQPRVPVDSERRSERRRAQATREQMTTRRMSTDQFVDDLRYDDVADPYEAASTRTGRAGYMKAQAPQRPKVKRRSSSAQNQTGRRSKKSQQVSSGGMGSFLLDNGHLVGLAVVAAAIILTVIIISSVSSCVRNATDTQRSDNKPVTTVTEGSDAADTTQSTQTETQTTETTTTTTPVTATVDETKVEVTVAVADAGITWVEVTLDGQSMVAETVTGPWSATYTVTRSIKIDVSEPAVVTVTRNGVTQTFENRASGVGTITIEGPSIPETTDEQGTESGSTTLADGTVVTNNGSYTPIQYNDDGSWYDENWYYHDGNGGYYDNDGNYHTE